LTYFDKPYGKKVELWDQSVLRSDYLVRWLQHSIAVNSSETNVLAINVDYSDYGRVEKIVKENGWPDTHPLTWYKPGQNATGIDCYIYATEVILMAYRPRMKLCPYYGIEKNPTKRHNMISIPTVNTKVMHMDGQPVNRHQKPTGIIRYLINNHCAPGAHVLVCGFGSGSEIVGCLQSGMNVIGVEQDSRQFEALRARLLNWEDEEVLDVDTFDFEDDDIEIISSKVKPTVVKVEQQQQEPKAKETETKAEDTEKQKPEETEVTDTKKVKLPEPGDMCMVCGKDWTVGEKAVCTQDSMAFHQECGTWGQKGRGKKIKKDIFCCPECCILSKYKIVEETTEASAVY
jgi:hypothetical protein